MSETTVPMGLRERKALRTRAAIQRAAAELTIEGGLQAATIHRIAERADVSPRTVSTYFPGKDDIFFADTPELAARFHDALANGTGSTVDRIQQWVDGLAEVVHQENAHADEAELAQYRRDRELRHRAVTDTPELRAKEAQLLAPMMDDLAAAFALETGQQANDAGPRYFAAATFGIFRELAARSAPDDTEFGLGEIRHALDFLRAGAPVLAAPRAED